MIENTMKDYWDQEITKKRKRLKKFNLPTPWKKNNRRQIEYIRDKVIWRSNTKWQISDHPHEIKIRSR